MNSSLCQQGLVDTSDGVFFSSMLGHRVKIENGNDTTSRDNSYNSTCPPNVPFRSLVEVSDKRFATDYAYFVMSQMTTTTFTEADRLGKRKG